MEYGSSTWDMVYRFGYLPYRYGHPGYRYRIWSNDMGDDSIDSVIFHIDMGYLVSLGPGRGKEGGECELVHCQTWEVEDEAASVHRRPVKV
jgi:hypothetical protein